MTTPWQGLLHADPWARDLVDLPSLNARASTAVDRAIEQTRVAARQDPATVRGRSIVVLGPAGAGKTHLFARLRRSLGRRAGFVLVRPLLGAPISPRYLLMQIVEQLARESLGTARIHLASGSGARAFTQLDALLGWVAADLVAGAAGSSGEFAELRPSSEQEQDDRVDRLVEGVIARWPHADETYLRLLIRTPFASPRERRALLTWLSGREPDEADLARIGLRAGMAEELVLPALKTLGAVAAAGAPIVLVLDQLENLIDPQDEGRVRSYGSLVAELVDEVPGIVVVQMALDSEWHRGIEPVLGASQRTRVAMELVPLALPTAREREGLLRLWAARLGYPPEAFPVPFGASSVRAWCVEPGMTPRMLLMACRRAVEGANLAGADQAGANQAGADQAGADQAGADQAGAERGGAEHRDDAEAGADASERCAESLARAWQEQLVRARTLIDRANEMGRPVEAELLADALGAAIGLVPTLRIASIDYRQVIQLVVDVEGEPVRVAIAARSHPRSVLALLTRLVDVAADARVVVMRERAHELLPTWRACLEKRDRLLESPNARWLHLEREDEARLLALQGLLSDARSRDLTDLAGRPLEPDTVRQWAQSELDPATWIPLRVLGEALLPPVSSSSHAPGVVASSGLDPIEPGALGTPSGDGANASDGVGPALALLRQLRVASLDRLVREVSRVHAHCGRSDVLAELSGAAARVQWFGRSVVAIKEEP